MLVVLDDAEMENLSFRYNTPQLFLSTTHPHFARFLQSGGLKVKLVNFFTNTVTAGSVLSTIFFFNFRKNKRLQYNEHVFFRTRVIKITSS